MGPGAASSGGFTLLEIMIVLVIITLTTSFAVPALRDSLYTDQLKSTSRKLVGLVSEASQEALGSRAAHLLHVDFERNLVWITPESPAPDESEPRRLREMKIPESVRVAGVASVYGGKRAGGTTTIRFTEKGYVDRTFIHLRSEDGRVMTLMLSPFMVVSRISDAYVELEDQAASF
ncbi:MAG: prepilin-type N-terminal cleavage/methylation domain-containing protein [Desulfobulbaceae bacterium]|jgi:prepilin-type N-terminal cleavage/methylation domain-containing protein|nr:prepilin-type N-terminal cleavage/methylation domain-containing protein [Desulfobulbaceae bacterium]